MGSLKIFPNILVEPTNSTVHRRTHGQLEKNNKVKLILVGIITILLLQALIHVGVNIRLFPTTGMTLPYISYGGSSIISTSILSGIILNLTKRRVIDFNEKKNTN